MMKMKQACNAAISNPSDRVGEYATASCPIKFEDGRSWQLLHFYVLLFVCFLVCFLVLCAETPRFTYILRI